MSNDALAIAATGMKAQQYEIDAISNDFANINTNGYKSSNVNFADVMYKPAQTTQGLAEQTQDQLGVGTIVESTTKNFALGALKQTQNPENIAINGNGFFEITQADGSYAYTRSNTLKPDSDGYLVTQGGYRLSDNIQLPPDTVAYQIGQDGTVSVRLNNQTDLMEIGHIQLAKFMDPGALTAKGDGLYVTNNQSGEAYLDAPGQNGLGVLAQGMIEASNVNMVEEMMRLTMAQRAYQLNAKIAQVSDELDKQTNELRR
ncbi:MAG: flagellar hook-basal body complex protein [Proteobacteria bacterium]|nr:flagellar hook-basal body complex protein [Pseudomonadota bacterium]